jgi:predicted Fe-S protein YdhL (DUF1289 family)
MAISSTDIVEQIPVESPCIRLCTLDDDDICVGCFRSMAEICAWGGAADDERRQILAASELRRKATTRRAKRKRA